MKSTKPWGGRFLQNTNAFVESFTASIGFDVRLFRQDILGSIVHCRMLARQKILEQNESDRIVQGLESVLKEMERGDIPLDVALEDIHMHVEHRLKEIIGPLAGKLHTARSRNDQVATDLRLYLREELDAMREEIVFLQQELITLADRHVETVLPGLTHLQNAQPISLAHHLLAYVEMLLRDDERLTDLRRRINQLPLGAAALAGAPYPIDRHWVAEQLGFEGVCENSLDAVSDRDFAVELVSACAIIMMHLSRFSEELVLWSAPAYGFVELSDAFCTGSSIMPQKKNPDVPELIRGKTGRVNGHLIALLTLMKALPLAYNKDMQEDKEPVFDAVDTVRASLKIFAAMIPAMKINRAAMASAAREGFTTATDLADDLARRNIPFREAHAIVGRLVQYAIQTHRSLDQLTLDEMRKVDDRIGPEAHQKLSVQSSINARRALGGTAFETVREAIGRVKKKLEGRSRLR